MSLQQQQAPKQTHADKTLVPSHRSDRSLSTHPQHQQQYSPHSRIAATVCHRAADRRASRSCCAPCAFWPRVPRPDAGSPCKPHAARSSRPPIARSSSPPARHPLSRRRPHRLPLPPSCRHPRRAAARRATPQAMRRGSRATTPAPTCRLATMTPCSASWWTCATSWPAHSRRAAAWWMCTATLWEHRR